MDQEKIGKFIAAKRKEKNITQKEFAEMLNVTDKTVSRWENGHYLPDVSLFKKLCEILEIEVMELLNGEKNVNKREAEQTIMNIIDLSDKNQKKKVSKVLKLSGIVICLIVIIFGITYGMNKLKLNKLQNELSYYQEAKVDKILTYPYRFAFKDIGDGWICTMSIEYVKNNLDVPYYYGYSCVNMKYQYIDGFNYSYDNEKHFYIYEFGLGYATYFYNKEYREEMTSISEYFIKKKFVNEITMDDLEELDLKKINKNDVVDLFNEAINSELVNESGNYENISPIIINESRIRKSDKWFGKERDYKFLLGYISHDGYIYYVNIELMIDYEYLSDIVISGKATDEQKILYDEIQVLEKDIIDKQSFKGAFETYNNDVLTALQDNIYLVEANQKDKDYSTYFFTIDY